MCRLVGALSVWLTFAHHLNIKYWCGHGSARWLCVMREHRRFVFGKLIFPPDCAGRTNTSIGELFRECFYRLQPISYQTITTTKRTSVQVRRGKELFFSWIGLFERSTSGLRFVVAKIVLVGCNICDKGNWTKWFTVTLNKMTLIQW